MSSPRSSLTSLPPEILVCLTTHLHDIEDFLSLVSTCRRLRAVVSQGTSPNHVLHLCSRSAPTFFSPHPHFLVAATARRLSEICLGDADLTAQLITAFKSGIEGLYAFALKHSGITLQELSQWHLGRFSAINPLSDRIDKMAGQQWYSAESFWDGGVSSAFTVYCEAGRAAMQVIIYGELFRESMDAFLDPSNFSDGKMIKPCFDLSVRMEYIKYCIPDWCCRSYPGLVVEKVGPYADGQCTVSDQCTLQHMFYGGRWIRMWRSILRQIGPDFWNQEAEEARLEEEHGFIGARNRQDITLNHNVNEIRQLLWWNAAVLTGGLEGAKAVQYGAVTNSAIDKTLVEGRQVSEEVRKHLTSIRQRIEDLDDELVSSIGSTVLGTNVQETISDVPDFGKEVGFCMRSLWPM